MKPRNQLQNVIENLSETVEIVDLAERLGVAVKHSGTVPVARCIVHDDTNPSMSLFPKSGKGRSHYHCFVCSAHGDIFDFVSEVNKVDFKGAVDWLAQAYGLSSASPIKVSPKLQATTKKDRAVPAMPQNYSAYESALRIFRQSNNTELEEWLRRRDLPQTIANAAELCFVEPRTLSKYLVNIQSEFGTFRELLGNLEGIGLVRPDLKKEVVDAKTYLNLGKQYRDFFNDGRIIFAIRDAKDQLLGFAGRKVSDTSTAPKYLFSPQLPKAQLLYRAAAAFSRLTSDLNQGIAPILYICEGLLDALRMESLGFCAVAVLGARLSEPQSMLILDLAAKFPNKQPLQVRFFLDRDGPGLKGAAASIALLLKLDREVRTELGFVWPLGANTDPDSSDGLKDPDEILKKFDNKVAAAALIDQSTYPVAVALLAEKLNVPPNDIIDDNRWATLPLGAKYRSALYLDSVTDRLAARATDLVVPGAESGQWLTDVNLFLASPLSEVRSSSGSGLEDPVLRLNLARELAQSGANKGEVLSDIAAWRRIDVAATAFNEGLRSRLQQQYFQPIEPFDAVHVSRGFGKTEARLKAMPCPEDLIVQQYVLNEILTDRLDDGTGKRFSNFVPAVRFYRSLNLTRTTGEGKCSEQNETLSFAYQIDMEVLEGRQPGGDSGIFRPYFECWKGFIASLLRVGEKMDQVHMVRLDLKRYYDRLRRSIVRDILRQAIEPAYDLLGERQKTFAPLFAPPHFLHQRAGATIDFLLDQSFGYCYYHPTTGATESSERDIGIPQGPILSAWLGNIVLFKLDAVLRLRLAELNNDGVIRAGYARYVDDVVLLGSSLEILDILRSVAEDVARELQLELISKESFAPMSTAEFSKHLTEGRALAASGPREETTLIECGDGDAGWGMWQTESPDRHTSLELLRDPRLYAAPSNTIRDQIFTALRANDLRPAELSKAARWLWYRSAKEMTEDADAADFLHHFWKSWNDVCADAPFSLAVNEMPWDDPVFFALEGLESLFEMANRRVYGLTPEESAERTESIAKLARAATTLEFANFFMSPPTQDAPKGWSEGAVRLQRMLLQRIICMRWKAAQLSARTDQKVQHLSINELLKRKSETLMVSLQRALITDSETCFQPMKIYTALGQSVENFNPFRETFNWLHRAIVSFSQHCLEANLDPLQPLQEDLKRISDTLESENGKPFVVKGDKFLSILQTLLVPESEHSNDAVPLIDASVLMLALETLAAIAPRENLIQLLSRRQHLLEAMGEKLPLPLPPLPGLPANGLLFVAFADQVSSHAGIIDAVWWVTVPPANAEDVSVPKFRLATAGNAPVDIDLTWTIAATTGHLHILKATWAIPDMSTYVFVHPPVLSISASSLAWAADIFEALARLNKAIESPNTTTREFVPAWPYLAVSTLPENPTSKLTQVSLLTPVTMTAMVDGQAFIRDGSRGLQTYEVPEQYGHFWRAGVMLTDLFGLRRELDRYAALKPDGSAPQEAENDLEPATHLLRNVLHKLRGGHFNGQVLRAQAHKDYLPATFARSLKLLREFRDDGDGRNGTRYVLCSEAESSAMRVRLNSPVPLHCPGIAAAFAERIALGVAARLPLAWARHLIEGAVPEYAFPKRVIPRTWIDLASRIMALLPPNKSDVPIDRSFSVLVAGLRIAALSAWLRSIALEIEVLGTAEDWPFPNDGDISYAWQLEEKGLLFDDTLASANTLSDRFRRGVADSSPQKVFADITPLGWLVLVAGRVGLLGQVTRRPLETQWQQEQTEQFKALANTLALVATTTSNDENDVDVDWPLEFNNPGTIDQWLSPQFEASFALLVDIEKNIGITVRYGIQGSWKLDPAERTFTDNESHTWEIRRWQVWLSNGTKPERRRDKRKLLSIWEETRDREGNLLLISARDERMAKLLSPDSEQPADGVKIISISPPAIESDGTILAPPAILESEPLSENEAPTHSALNHSEIRQAGSDKLTKAESFDSESLNALKPPVSPSEVIIDEVRQLWRQTQSGAWGRRKLRSPGHIRVALMQWDVDETYHHPIIDTDRWRNEWPPKGSFSSMEPSKIEHRRRELINEALLACANFGVQLLVLPEYSVRPETVSWLRTQLQRRKGMPSVLAGTYKLHGNATDVGFDETYREILGASDFGKTFENRSVGAPGTIPTSSSGEHSAILTLLSPLELDGNVGARIVCAFSRRKKYPSLAAGEIINPLTEPLRPLYSSEALYHELASRNAAGNRQTTGGHAISALSMLGYATQRGELQYLAEFVCSELFLPMSPVNHHSLAAELQKMATRFGAWLSEEEAQKKVNADLLDIAAYLGTADGTRKFNRRSLLLVPAMTTRSADYWIFGQAALLAGGATTVFCNAATKGMAVGGSCFVGRNSWNSEEPEVHSDAITPYCGWSKGIYYGHPTDALGRKEQAVVIADIDPTFMQEGKPRPQALAVPLQLVAYLPIVEVCDGKATAFSKEIAASLEKIASLLSNQIVPPHDNAFDDMQSRITEELKKTDDDGFANRIQHWRDHWRANPTAGAPAGFVDWLWADTTTNGKEMPKIFVPDWGGNDV